MRWSLKKYPEKMRFLPTIVRRKAIDIANALYSEKKKESEVIEKAISKALEWAKEKELMQEYFQSKVFTGNCCIEVRYEENRWQVKTFENDTVVSSKDFRTKAEAMHYGKILGREIKYILFIYGLNNTLLQKIDFSFGKA